MTSESLWAVSPEPWKPHAYQKKAVKFLLEHGAGALLLDPGLGKSSITLAALKMLKERKMLERVLLVAPLRVCHSVWPNEMQKWEDFNDLTHVVLHGKDKEDLLARDADIYIINPDGLPWLFGMDDESGRVDMRRWRRHGFDTLVVDELSKFKHTKSRRFRAMRQVIGSFRRRWGLTGSPAANGLMDLFGQLYVLDEGRSLGKYVTHYRMKYFVQSYDGYSWKLRDGADEEIYERIRPVALRMSGEDYLDLPQRVDNVIRVELPKKARQVYDQVESEFVAAIDDDLIVAANAAAASTKCRQVANGGVYVDDLEASLGGAGLARSTEREVLDLHEAKLDALEDLVDELQGSPLLVAYDFEHDLKRIRKRLGKDVPHIGGGVTAKRSAELAAAWNRGEIPVLLGHPQAMAHGLNMQGAGSHVCWHSLTWNFELYDQFVRRVLRQGSKAEKVFVHHIVARDTVDEAVLASLRSKRRGQDALFEALTNYRRRRRKATS